MVTGDRPGRTDTGERLIRAEPDSIYHALTDPAAIVQWRPPAGMHGKVHRFEPRKGGSFSMSWIYDDEAIAGKTSSNADTFEGRLLDLVPGRRVVEEIRFQSDDPAFAEPMVIATVLDPENGGTRVTVTCSNVPDVIGKADHLAGIASSLANLAAFVEQPQ